MTPNPATTAARLKKLLPFRPTLAIILGSGYRHLLERVKVVKRIPVAKLRGFHKPTVVGHGNELVAGHLGGTPVLVLSGRVHYYEGHSMEVVGFPVRVLAEFGVRALLITNAAGGINRRFRPGDFMQLADHLNFMGENPLRGQTPPGRERFVDLSQTYDPALGALLNKAARRAGIRLHAGVYAAVTGPSYETPAEIRALGRLGADAVGMSTVPEAIVARQYGVQVAAISCITNFAAGLGKGPLSHREVIEVAERVKPQAIALIEKFAVLYGQRR